MFFKIHKKEDTSAQFIWVSVLSKLLENTILEHLTFRFKDIQFHVCILKKNPCHITYDVVLNILTKHQTSQDHQLSMKTHFIVHP